MKEEILKLLDAQIAGLINEIEHEKKAIQNTKIYIEQKKYRIRILVNTRSLIEKQKVNTKP
jgi:hypothetical protein